MGGRRTGRGRVGITDKIYLMCAVHFGWDKYTVDKQPLKYLHNLFLAFMEEEKERASMAAKKVKKTIR